ncbi:hypothetical protein ATCVGM07011_202R [Acanthocystis turfacea Chlorella virus GM0701.1]|nr:hypothetical protein ATCVGM07011_202R [Acanthocystis turfacea Chlorella virus GM0701.1]
MVYKDPDYQKKYREKNKEANKEYQAKRLEDHNKNALESIRSGKIIDKKKWNLWCNGIKHYAKNSQKPYSNEFTNDAMFDMMVQGCFYCGDIATTIDRIDSKLDHTLENCVGCCYGCNNSKGSADPSTFIKKAYYRARGKYIDDDDDIWFPHKIKPRMDIYKKRAEKKGVLFELENDDWKQLIKGECAYCHRIPDTWFGVDRVIPENGYTIENAVSCCYDCNIDKHECDIETMAKRNERIAGRVDAGEIVIEDYEQVILHIGKQKKSKKVCAYGIVYDSKLEASRALGRCKDYIKRCINLGRHSNDIFEITD